MPVEIEEAHAHSSFRLADDPFDSSAVPGEEAARETHLIVGALLSGVLSPWQVKVMTCEFTTGDTPVQQKAEMLGIKQKAYRTYKSRSLDKLRKSLVRFRTGQPVVLHGYYQFDGYCDGSVLPPPTADEQDIELSPPDPFPSIASANKDCWWKLRRLLFNSNMSTRTL